MRLSRKISYDRFCELDCKEQFTTLFDEKSFDIQMSDLNFYFIIEYENAFDAVDYENMFPENSQFIDFQSLKMEHTNIISRIKKQMDNKKMPDFLKKLGVTNILKGCYLVGSKGHDLPKNIRTSTKKIISVKLNYVNLPKEILDICSEFYSKNMFHIVKEQEEFDNFFKLTPKEQEKEMAMLLQQFSNYTNKSILFSMMNTGATNSGFSTTGSTQSLEDLFEKNVDAFTDIPFLEQVFDKAKDDENYELCKKIFDRINVIKKFI